MSFLYENNCVVKVVDAIGNFDTTITVEEVGRFPTFQFSRTRPMLATITHKDVPGAFEIVALIGTDEGAADPTKAFLVERGLENAGQWVWPAGATLSARVTAGMLRGFPHVDDYGFMHVLRGDGVDTSFALCGVPFIPRRRADTTTGFFYGGLDEAFGLSIAGTTHPVDLGVTPPWSTGLYSSGAVVVPSTPDGFQYWLDLYRHEPESRADMEPTWGGDSDPTPAEGYGEQVGFWVPTALPIETSIHFYYRLCVTEVGFIADHVGADLATKPVVSIGNGVSATAYANGVELTQISNNNSIHRIPVTTGGELVTSLQFALDSAATGDSFRGRFYFRGFFVETS